LLGFRNTSSCNIVQRFATSRASHTSHADAFPKVGARETCARSNDVADPVSSKWSFLEHNVP